MRILILSDIHSNIVALDAVLEDAGEHDAVWCLGDVVGYGPAPNECCERLIGLQAVSLAGNHDWAVLGKLSTSDFNPHARRAADWTEKVLSRANREWLDGLADRNEISEDLTLVHGSPRFPIWEYILSTGVAAENMEYFETRACLFGHTHVPSLFAFKPGERRVGGAILHPDDTVELKEFEKCLLNPGSVGQPRDRDPRAAYAILNTETLTFTPSRVEYDIAATQATMKKVGLPQPLIERLAHGL